MYRIKTIHTVVDFTHVTVFGYWKLYTDRHTTIIYNNDDDNDDDNNDEK